MASILQLSETIQSLKAGRHLSREETRRIFELIMTGQVDPQIMAEFLKALAIKGETVEEIAGAADVMNEKVTRVRCDADCSDTCGAGGEGISTFNVSTTAAIIAAAAGATVAKHGNRTSTRVSGSAEAIGQLGVNLDADVPTLERSLRECRMAFLYAPNLHPAMKHAVAVRKALGIRTIFNLLGPLTNPAGARRQLLGTSRPDLTETLARVLARRGVTFSWVVHAHNGLCDLSITGSTRITEVHGGDIRTFEISPGDVGMSTASLDTLLVGSPAESAAAIRAILEGKDRGPRRRHALLNAAAALVVAGLVNDFGAGLDRAAYAIDSGQAVATLDKLIMVSRSG